MLVRTTEAFPNWSGGVGGRWGWGWQGMEGGGECGRSVCREAIAWHWQPAPSPETLSTLLSLSLSLSLGLFPRSHPRAPSPSARSRAYQCRVRVLRLVLLPEGEKAQAHVLAHFAPYLEPDHERFRVNWGQRHQEPAKPAAHVRELDLAAGHSKVADRLALPGRGGGGRG